MALNEKAIITSHGTSMAPFIRPERDKLRLVRVSKNDRVEVGDIVMARTQEGHAVIHRVYSVDFSKNGVEFFILMGDANRQQTEYCIREQIIARVDQIIHPDGSVTDCNDLRFRLSSCLWRHLTWARPMLQSLLKERE